MREVSFDRVGDVADVEPLTIHVEARGEVEAAIHDLTSWYLLEPHVVLLHPGGHRGLIAVVEVNEPAGRFLINPPLPPFTADI